jgi:hypothetical protein
MKNLAALQFLKQTGAPGTYYRNPFHNYHNQKAQIFRLAHSPSEWHTYTIHVSRLKNPSVTCNLPFIYTDLKWI